MERVAGSQDNSSANPNLNEHLQGLPEHIQRNLGAFSRAAQDSLGKNLVSIVLFGSAAEGRLRTTSDVNLILVINQFVSSEIDQLREAFRTAHASIRLNVMFLLQSELNTAAETFALKFADIIARHRVLIGKDPFADLSISRQATLNRLLQTFMNLSLRLRERYALVSLREEQLIPIIAEVAGPLRAGAATILALEGKPHIQPKEALEQLCERLSNGPVQGGWSIVLRNLSKARETQNLPPGEAATTILALHDLCLGIHQLLQTME